MKNVRFKGCEHHEFKNSSADQIAVNPTEFSHDNSLLTLQEVNAFDEEDRNVFFEDCLPEHLRPPDCVDLDLDDGETMGGIYEPDESEFENDTTHNTPANKTHMKTVTFIESAEVRTFATSTPSFTPSTPPSSFAPRISSSSATVSRQHIMKGKRDMNGQDDSDDSDFADDTFRPSWATSAFREPPASHATSSSSPSSSSFARFYTWCTKGKGKQEIKRVIMEIYAKHNPSKLAGVDELMSKYKGRELELLEAICDKYA